ncbi:unnamed protein product [Arctogadus glacialis]
MRSGDWFYCMVRDQLKACEDRGPGQHVSPCGTPRVGGGGGRGGGPQSRGVEGGEGPAGARQTQSDFKPEICSHIVRQGRLEVNTLSLS